MLPGPARGRLLHLLRILEGAREGGIPALNSAELEERSGWSRDTIRKDISCLAGYAPERLAPLIRLALGLERRRKFCVVGLGRLGSAYLNLDPASLGEFDLAAGFDSNVNRVEILPSPVPLYPAHKMGELIGRLGIEIALLCVPAGEAQRAAERLAASGIGGIVNFAPVILNLSGQGNRPVAVRNVHVADELRALAVDMGCAEKRTTYL